MPESREPPRSPPAPSGLVGTLLALVGAIRDWRQLAVLLVLVVVGAVGFFLYENRARLGLAFEQLLTGPPTLMLADGATAQTALRQLTTQLGLVVAPVAGAVVWHVDIAHNRRVIVAIETSPEVAAAVPELRLGTVTPLFLRTPGVHGHALLMGVLDGEMACGAPTGVRTVHDGLDALMPVVCMVGIPPSAEALVGTVAVGFARPLSAQQTDIVKATMKAAAEVLGVYR
jgi:hypothetical protein